MERHLKRVETIRWDSSLHAAARAMRHEAVGCLVVVDADERPVGILTDRDLALRAIATSHAPATLRVDAVMSSDPVTVAPDAPLRDVVALMKHHGIRRLPVVRDGKILGIVTLDDLLEELTRELRDLAAEAPSRYRTAPSSSRFEHVRQSIERGLEEVRSKLQYAQWHGRATLLDKLDELRARLHETREDRED